MPIKSILDYTSVHLSPATKDEYMLRLMPTNNGTNSSREKHAKNGPVNA